MKQIITLLVMSLFIIQSCRKKEDPQEPYKGRNYFPVNAGHQVIYDVESITKSAVTGLWDTVTYQVKEITTGTYTDSEGRSTQTIERYIQHDTTTGFVLDKIWAANLLTSSALRLEDNIHYVKLIFPQSIGSVWDGNVQNTLGAKHYHYSELHIPMTFGALAFDSTCTVIQADDSTEFGGTITDVNYYVEKYATNVGMIYKINKYLRYNINDTVESGTIYTESLISFIN